MIHSSHRREALQAAIPVAMGFLLLVLLWLSPMPAAIKGWANYLPLHMALETAAIFFAGMIFAITWHTPRTQTTLNAVVVGCLFGGVALLDFTHMLSYAGMPSFVTPSDSNKAIYFWLSARALAAMGLFVVAIPRWHRPATQHEAKLWLMLVLCTVAAAHALILFDMPLLPVAFVAGAGLTPWKIHTEYWLVALYCLPLLWLAPRLLRPRTHHVSGLMAAAALMAMSEFMLTLYSDVTDLYNFSGHLLKIAAYFYLYRPLFVELLQNPYEHLQEALSEQQATLHALPDLLFELDEDGRFVSVHTGRTHMLLMSPSDFVGKTMREVLPRETADIGMQAIHEASQLGISHGKRYALDLPAGRMHFELSVAAKLPPGAPNNRYIFIARDVTGRVLDEQNLQKEARRNAALMQLSQLDNALSSRERFQQVLAHMVDLTDSQVGFVGRLSPNGCILDDVAVSRPGGISSSTGDTAHTLQENDIWHKAIREHRPVIFNEAGTLPVPSGLPESLGNLSNWISLPVFDGKHLVMVAGIGNKTGSYTDNDVEFLHLMAYSLWQVTHKLETDVALRRFSMAAEQNPNPIIITDVKACIEYVNNAFTQVSGYSAEEALGKNPRFLQSGKTLPSVYKDMWSRLLSGQAWTGELINRRKTGQEYYESALIFPIRNDAGVITHYLAHKEDVSERKSDAQRIQYLSDFDQLTGLPNRVLLLEQLQFEIAQAQQSEQSVLVLWLNLDLFKDINDAFGHEAGDSILREVARRLRNQAKGRDLIARYSGDNFIMVRSNIEQFGASRLVSQLFETLSHPIVLHGQELVLTASMGLSFYPNDGLSANDLLRCAETAMYRVKHTSRNSYSFFSPDMQARTARALQLTNALKLAFGRDELRLVYQPQVSLHDGKPSGAEALIRWHHPQLGDIAPAEFIPLVENAGLSTQLGEWVLQRALDDLRSWQQQGLALVKVAINLSANQFAETDLAARIQAQLEKSGVPAQWLELELTEVAAMKNPTQAIATMLALSALGLSLSIDDFGTGYSSLSQLKRFDVHKLKIDQSFVRDVVHDSEDQAIVLAIVHMAHSMGMVTLAEGVETPEQLAYLRAQQCDQIQGYLYSHPLEREDFAQWLRAPHALALPA